ncbi:MAG: hypothetical protein Q9165_007896 [Trypethelium subeluteriae]
MTGLNQLSLPDSYSPTTYLGVFQWTKYEENLITVSEREICTQRAEILDHTGLTLFPKLPGQPDWLITGGNYSAESIGSLPMEAYTIVPGWQTCHGFGDGVPITNAVANKITKTYWSTKKIPTVTYAYTTSSIIHSSSASPVSGPTSQARSTSTALSSPAPVSQAQSQSPPGMSQGMPAGSVGVSPEMLSGSEVSTLHSTTPLPSEPSTETFSSSDGVEASQSYIVVASSTYYDNSDGNYILGTQTYTPGSPAITISGQPISIPASRPQLNTLSTQNFVVYDSHTFLANSAQNYVFGKQTYHPGDPAITATLTYPNSASPKQPPQTLTETISFPAISPSSSSAAATANSSSAWAPWHKGAVNAVVTWQHHTYTFYGDGNMNENVLSGHTLVTGGPPLTIDGQTIWLDATGGLNAQYSPSDSGALPTPTDAEGVSSVAIGGMGGPTTVGMGAGMGTVAGMAGATTTSVSGASRRGGEVWWRCWAGGLCSLGMRLTFFKEILKNGKNEAAKVTSNPKRNWSQPKFLSKACLE